MPSTRSRASKLSHAVLAALLAVLALACLQAARAGASEGSQYGAIGQYGEVTRFGGFDSTWFDGGKYDGSGTEASPAADRFIDPVGLAVDTADKTSGGDGTAVYVLDRVSGIETGDAPPEGTQWRLQKLSDKGAILGVSEFYLPNTGVTSGDFASTGVEYLAVDDATGSVYTLLYELNESGTPTVAEILDWSTQPQAGKLVASNEAKLDTISKPVSGYASAGLLSSSAQISGANLYDPQGIALDGSKGLAVAAQGSYNGGNPAGPAVVRQVSVTSGAPGSTWTSSGLDGAENASANEEGLPVEGIFAASGGSLDVVLARAEFGATADVVGISEDLTKQTILSSEATEPSALGSVLGWLDLPYFPTNSGAEPAAELSNGLYAASFRQEGAFWDASHNDGIQLVQPESNGLLSNAAPPLTSVFDTLANAPDSSGPCSIDNLTRHPDYPTLAPGANGAIWVLTQGQDTASFDGEEESSFTYGRQLIELAPKAPAACVGPSGTFSLGEEGGSPQPASEPLVVAAGSTVELNASSIDYPLGTEKANIYAIDWAPTGVSNGYTIVNDTPEEAGAIHPTETATYKYETPGEYTVALKLLGDFGEYDETGTVVVQTTTPPTAKFTAPETAQTGQKISLDASGSSPAPGTHISDYHWSFGDGQSDDKDIATETHTYTSPGTYTVTLTVHDNDDRASSPATRQITVTSPSSGGGGGGNSGGGGGTTTTPTTATTPITTPFVDRSPTSVSPRAKEVDGAVQVVVSCPATKASCAGTIAVRTASAVAAKKAKKSVLALGTGSFTLAAGATRTITIKLSAKGSALLKKDRTLKVLVLVTAHDSYGDPLAKTLVLTLRKPAASRPKHKK